jgi:hypothetical protein
MIDPNSPSFAFDELPLHWQMPRADKFALEGLLRVIRPEVSVEIGTYRGGSLQILSRYSGHVHSLDINAESQRALAEKFGNVTFHVGDSAKVLPEVLGRIGGGWSFALVDGNHSRAGVREDLRHLLAENPEARRWIVCHDSFNPDCRRGILEAPWRENEYVRLLEVDFVSGVFHRHSYDTGRAASMWGGLAVGFLEGTAGREPAEIRQSQRVVFETMRLRSRHLWLEPWEKLMKRLRRRLRRGR